MRLLPLRRNKGMLTLFRYSLKASVGILTLAFLLSSGCRAGETLSENDHPVAQPVEGSDEWLKNLIRQLRQEKPANPPAKIYRYTYREQVVYHLTGRCCNLPGQVYDINGNVICEPDGGITGKGDRRCTDFFETRSNKTLIWEDNQEP